ncbi:MULTISPECIES: RDD family protein [Streptosporangium]|uniref:RDD family membrane protein YckC n=1 Tax=Streptosporangium brasiliense TaxID=47480 RepID=A0ABT9RIS9_9ACTN|nr:RDD family protein [Streptosporangium brasiliense]MDP9869199.1 putative RDD family membrane protein YckC [Streptosporangium brasiliense]
MLKKTQVGRAELRPRLVAAGWDYLAIVAWLTLLAVVFVPLHLAGAGVFDGLGMVSTDLLITGLTALPVGACLTIGEAGRRQATWGKRRAGLVVATVSGERPGTARIVVRNVVKLLPWQCGHMAVSRLARGHEVIFAMPLLVAAYALAGVSIALLLVRRDRAALHDLVAATRVVPSP